MGFYFSMHHPHISFCLSTAFTPIVADYVVACVALRVSSNSQDLHHTLSGMRDIVLSASAAMIILLYFRFAILKSLPRPCENPQPSALIIMRTSSLERTRSTLCLSTFKIFGDSDISTRPDYLLLSEIAGLIIEHSVLNGVPIAVLLPVSPGIVDTRGYITNSHGINFTLHTLACMRRGQPSPLATFVTPVVSRLGV